MYTQIPDWFQPGREYNEKHMLRKILYYCQIYKIQKFWGYLQSETNCRWYCTVVMYSVEMQLKRRPPPGRSDPARSWWGPWSLPWLQLHAAHLLQSLSKDSAQDCTTGVHPERKKGAKSGQCLGESIYSRVSVVCFSSVQLEWNLHTQRGLQWHMTAVHITGLV